MSGSEFHIAAQTGDLAYIEAHMECIRMQTETLKTSLMFAAEKGHINCVRYLLSYEKNMADEQGHTALMYAARTGNVECVGALLPYEARSVNNFGHTALILAVINGHFDCVKLLIDKEAGMQDNNGWSALMYAASFNRYEYIPFLIQEAGLQSRKQYQRWVGGITSLMLVASKGSCPLNLVQALLQYEGGLTDSTKKLALQYAQTGKALASYKDCVNIHYDKVITELRTESDHDFRRRPRPIPGYTYLMHCAVMDNDLEASNFLFQAKQKDSEGKWALLLAIEAGSKKVVSLLMNFEADVVDAEGRTAFMVPIPRKSIEQSPNTSVTVQKSDSTSVTPQPPTKPAPASTSISMMPRSKTRTRSASHRAPYQKRTPPQCQTTTSTSTRENPIMNATPRGKTELMKAAEEGDTYAVRRLMITQSFVRDEEGHSALAYALFRRQTECAELLFHEHQLKDNEGVKYMTHLNRMVESSYGPKKEMLSSLRSQLKFLTHVPELPDILSKKYTISVQIQTSLGGSPVYLAYDGVLKLFAIKIISASSLGEESQNSLDKLKSYVHENVLTYRELTMSSYLHALFLVTDLCCYTLEEEYERRMRQEESFSDDEICSFLNQMARGLEYIRNKGSLHQHLSPRNVYLNSEGTYLIANYGLGQLLGSSYLQRQGIDGMYQAPEVYSGFPGNSKADVWSLGVMAYHLSTGSLPFSSIADILAGSFKPIMNRNQKLSTIIAWCLEKQPDKRPTLLKLVCELDATN
ncbi:Kinase, NEK [Giardia muris]|uniref:Kinase, NEK n=1 Tax=Giardia muris TaxID=5742 RepID=A0A4Z1SXW3_GIAMU|nr:Kinase, NEK [Giardia muris]|eukprot:TNJ29655.1 Kinase, NEK [Giardia muris]